MTREDIKSLSGRPSLWSLAESAAIERDADYVVGAWRPARHLESAAVRKHWINIAIMDLLKGRFRQASTCYLRFDGALARFDDLAKTDIARLMETDAQSALTLPATRKKL
jgi:replicative DNA helicase